MVILVIGATIQSSSGAKSKSPKNRSVTKSRSSDSRSKSNTLQEKKKFCESPEELKSCIDSCKRFMDCMELKNPNCPVMCQEACRRLTIIPECKARLISEIFRRREHIYSNLLLHQLENQAYFFHPGISNTSSIVEEKWPQASYKEFLPHQDLETSSSNSDEEATESSGQVDGLVDDILG